MNPDYMARLNRAIDYINEHIEEPLDLDTIARVAAFSKYHFHRVFSAAVGEPLGSYVQRLRLERAAALTADDRRETITDIAYRLNFSSPAVFSRAFRDYFGMSPSQWRRGGWREYHHSHKLQSNRYKPVASYRDTTRVSFGYGSFIKRQWQVSLKTRQSRLEYSVEIRDLPEKTVAYLRHTGPYAGDEQLFERLFSTLMKWAVPRDLYIPGQTELLTLYHDSPDITEEHKLRISACITVPEDTRPEGEIGLMRLPEGRYAVASFALGPQDYGDAWNSLFGGWLPESGYQCSEGPCYELYLNDPSQDPEGLHRLAIHIPVEPL
ncbi:MAG: AraC family transcriptional regulator [Spirochaetia bacterium]